MKRFTRKQPSYLRQNHYIDMSERLHKILNRIDIEKDALYADIPIRRNLDSFHAIADNLFGKLVNVSYSKSLDFIKHALSAYESSEKREVTVNVYQDLKEMIFLPTTILYGIQDAGIAPKSFLRTIENIITPGSYIDSGSRSSTGLKFGFGTTLDNSAFRGIGMPMIQQLTTEIDEDNNLILGVDIDRVTKIKVRFDKHFNAFQGDIDFFKGNQTKNKYFNNSILNYDSSVKYLICKELGDTLQAVYGKMMANALDDKKVCMFTNDEILTLRCKLMFLQVVYNIQRGNSFRTIFHYPVMSSIVLDFLNLWRSNTIKHNEIVTKDIEGRIIEKFYFTVGGNHITFRENDPIHTLFIKYISFIKQQTVEFEKINYNTMPTNTYRQISLTYSVPRLFIQKVLNNASLRIVFSKSEQDILLGGMTGGGNTKIMQPPFHFDEESDDYTIDRDYDDTFLPNIVTKHTLFTMFTKKYPEKSKDQLCYIVDGISSILYFYFNYFGESTSNEIFLQRIIDRYEAGTFGKQSLEDFEREFKIWAHADDEEELYKLRNNNKTSNTFINSPLKTKSSTPILAYGGSIWRKTRKMKRTAI